MGGKGAMEYKELYFYFANSDIEGCALWALPTTTTTKARRILCLDSL
jgi:hypothetical protein